MSPLEACPTSILACGHRSTVFSAHYQASQAPQGDPKTLHLYRHWETRERSRAPEIQNAYPRGERLGEFQGGGSSTRQPLVTVPRCCSTKLNLAGTHFGISDLGTLRPGSRPCSHAMLGDFLAPTSTLLLDLRCPIFCHSLTRVLSFSLQGCFFSRCLWTPSHHPSESSLPVGWLRYVSLYNT